MNVGQLLGLRGHGPPDGFHSVADGDHRGAARRIEILLALGGEQKAAFTTHGAWIIFTEATGEKRIAQAVVDHIGEPSGG
jgi:hypothetical protein